MNLRTLLPTSYDKKPISGITLEVRFTNQVNMANMLAEFNFSAYPKATFLVFGLVVCLLLGANSHVWAQRSYRCSFEQIVDVRAYPGKKFRLSAAVKVESRNNEAAAGLKARVYPQKGKGDVVVVSLDEQTREREWRRYSLEGVLDTAVEKVEIGGYCHLGGKFYFDDFLLEIETQKGYWEAIALQNPGFEQWTAAGLPRGWGEEIGIWENFKGSAAGKESAEGQYALLIQSDGYEVQAIHPPHQELLPFSLEPLFLDLPNPNISCMLQDAQGFVWIGTGSGLARYDGYEVRIFKHDPADSLSLSDNHVTALHLGQQGHLWVGTQSGGVNLYQSDTEQFRRFCHDSQDALSLSHNTVTTLFEDRKGFLWVGGMYGKGLNRLDPGTGQCKRYLPDREHPHSLQSNWVTDIAEDREGHIWVTTYASGIAHFDSQTERFQHYFALETFDEGWSSRYPLTMHLDRKGGFWLGTEDGLLRFDPHKREFSDRYQQAKLGYPGVYENAFFDIAESKAGAIWLAWGGGISRFDPSRGKFQVHFEPDHEKGYQSIMVDREGLIWIGTQSGIQIINPYKGQLRGSGLAVSLPEELRNEEPIVALQGNKDGSLWVAAESGVYQIETREGKVLQHLTKEAGDLHTHHIACFYEDRQGNMWISQANKGLSFWSPGEKRMHYIGTQDIHSIRVVWDILEDHQGKLWLGTWLGLWQYDRESGEFSRVSLKSDDGTGRNWTRVSTLFEDQEGTLWVGTVFGELKYLDTGTGKFHDMTPEGVDIEIAYGRDHVTSLHQDKKGNLWIGTKGNGLRKLDLKTGGFVHISEKDGLINNGVSGLLEDEEGNLWISTEGGLSCLNLQRLQFRNFNVTDGLPTLRLGPAWKSEKGGIFFLGTQKGLLFFHPDSVKANGMLPQVSFTSLETYRRGQAQPVSIAGIAQKNTLELSHHHDLINLKFSSLSFSKTANNQYAYRMLGLMEGWVALGNKREVTLANLPPGDYTLQVKGSNGDGLWNEVGSYLGIRVKPPWYWNLWSKLLYFLLLSGGVWGIYRFHLSRQLAAEETIRLKELDSAKTRFYTNITHEFRTPLTIILGMVQQIREHPEEVLGEGLDMIGSSGERLLNLVNQMLELRKLEAGELKLQMAQGDVIAFLRYILESFHSLSESKHIQLEFKSDRERLFMDYDPEKMLTIVSNLLSNAIKFTPTGGRITMKVGTEPCQEIQAEVNPVEREYLWLAVIDTGGGIPSEKQPFIFDRFFQADDSLTRRAEGTGIGLALTKELVRLHRGEIGVKSELGKGSMFFVCLPIAQEAPLLETSIAPSKEKAPRYREPIQEKSLKDPRIDPAPTLLLIDDNPDVIRFLSVSLEKDYNLLTASDGKEGFEKAVSMVPDLVLSDVMMPEMDGFELCSILKKDPRTSHIPIILLTAKADSDSRIAGLSCSADAYLSKPVELPELRIRIEKLLELRSELQRHYLTLAGLKEEWVTAPVPLAREEQVFLDQVRRLLEENLSNCEYTIEQLCQDVGMSSSQLHRKLTALTGLSANRFFRFVRLTRAKVLLEQTDLSVSQVAYDTGFNDPSYFTRVFKKEFGMNPRELK